MNPGNDKTRELSGYKKSITKCTKIATSRSVSPSQLTWRQWSCTGAWFLPCWSACNRLAHSGHDGQFNHPSLARHAVAARQCVAMALCQCHCIDCVGSGLHRVFVANGIGRASFSALDKPQKLGPRDPMASHQPTDLLNCICLARWRCGYRHAGLFVPGLLPTNPLITRCINGCRGVSLPTCCCMWWHKWCWAASASC